MENQAQHDLEAGHTVTEPDVAEQPDGAQENPTSNEMSGGRRRPGAFFGIRKRQAGMRGGGGTDYTKRYGKDFFGKEMSSYGRFWLTYVDEALIFDEEMVEMYKDNIDVLLVFAGLFSAVVSAFVIQSAQSLQPDSAAVSASLLIELVGYQRAASDTSSIPLSPFYPAISFSPSTSDIWVNSLWFISLTLSLITALVAVLTKQWLHQYISVVSDISPLSQGQIRQYRYMGLEKYQVPMIIGFLPILLHISLFLFFLGLCVYLFALHAVIAYAVASLSGIVFVAYIVCLFLPLVFYDCPYKTSLMDGMFRAIYGVISKFIRCKNLHRTVRDAERIKAGGDEERLTAGDEERLRAREALDTEAVSWLHSTSSNTSAQQIAFEAALPIHLDSQDCVNAKSILGILDSLARGNAKSIIDEIFERHTGSHRQTRFSPAASEPPRKIYKDTTSSLLAILDRPETKLAEGIWTCLLNYEEWEVSPWADSASSVTQLAAKLMEAWQKGLTSGLPSNAIARPSNSVKASLQDYLSSPNTEVTSALFNGLSIMTRSLFGPSSPGALVDVMKMFGDQLRDKTNPQNDDYLVQGISDTIDVIEYLRRLPDRLACLACLPDRLARLADRLADRLDRLKHADRLADRLADQRALQAQRVEQVLRIHRALQVLQVLQDLPDLQVMQVLLDLRRDLSDVKDLDANMHDLDNVIYNFERVIQLLYTQDLQQKTCAQNAFLISSSCKFPKAEKPETHLALLKILCCSGRYAFMFTDSHSQSEIFFTNAIQCFLSNQSERAHLQRERDVVEMILDPFFNQEYITDRDHAPGPFELKDHGILLKMFEEEGGLQALDRKFEAMLAQSATPEELTPTIDFAHLVTNQMIKTNTFDPLHLPDYAPKSPFTDDLFVLICLLWYNLSHLPTISHLLKPLHQRTMAHLTWKEFVEQLRQWVADKWKDLGRPHNIRNSHCLPDLLLEDAEELLVDPQSTA